MENSLHILLTSDERIICAILKDHLCNLGHQVEVVRDGHTALKKINAQHYDLALVDLCMPGINDIECLAKVQHNRQETPVVLISGDDTLRKVIEAFRLDVGNALSQSIQVPNVNGGHKKERRLGKLHRSRLKDQCFVGNSSATQQVRKRLRQAVEANVDTILLTGETGTGKIENMGVRSSALLLINISPSVSQSAETLKLLSTPHTTVKWFPISIAFSTL